MSGIKYSLIILSLLLLSFFSCDTSKEIETLDCGVENPLEDLPWLKEIKDIITMRMSPAGAQIIQYTYHGEQVFWIDECYNCPDAIITINNCEGEVICEFGGIDGRNTCPDFASDASDSTMLFDYVNH